jgi:hypothetical protein
MEEHKTVCQGSRLAPEALARQCLHGVHQGKCHTTCQTSLYSTLLAAAACSAVHCMVGGPPVLQPLYFPFSLHPWTFNVVRRERENKLRRVLNDDDELFLLKDCLQLARSRSLWGWRMLPLLLLFVTSHASCVGQGQIAPPTEIVWAGQSRTVSGAMEWRGWRVQRLRGGGRSWIKRTIKAASKKERQRKKRNINSTNLRASVKLDPNAVPPGLLLKNELDNQAEAWLLGGCQPAALPTVEPLRAIEEAKKRLQALPDKKPPAPLALKSRREEDSKMIKGDEDEQEFQDVGSKGSRAVRPAKGSHRNASADPKKRSIKTENSRREKPRKGASMRLRGGAGEASNDDESSFVSDATSSVVSSSSSSESARQDAHASAPSARAAPEPPVLPKQEVKNKQVNELSEKMRKLDIGRGKEQRSREASQAAAATPRQNKESARTQSEAAPSREMDEVVEEEGDFEMGPGLSSSEMSGSDDTGSNKEGASKDDEEEEEEQELFSSSLQESDEDDSWLQDSDEEVAGSPRSAIASAKQHR